MGALQMLATTSARLGPYQLTECIGRGGMAAVYKGKRRGPGGFEKQVVVKTILPSLASKPRFRRMFRDEARLTAQLAHANVVQLLDFGIVEDTPFLELEYLSGCDLRKVWETAIRRTARIPVGVALAIATEVCRGLAYAHAFVDAKGVPRPIIHRDVSPGNVMICMDGSIKLLDFGLACLTHGEALAIDTFQGKIAYMSPEQLDKRTVDRRADVFALGAILHELLTARRLFVGDDDGATVRNIRSMPVPAPSELNREVPGVVDVVVLRALARDPDRRWSSAVELLAALEELGGLCASRKELLAWLGALVPEVFTTACEGCGRRLPMGAACNGCMTTPDGPRVAEPLVVVSSQLVPKAPPPTKPARAPRTPFWQSCWLRVRLGATLWWRERQTLFAERQLRRAEAHLRAVESGF
jgi:serine/threonine-protein kinase